MHTKSTLMKILYAILFLILSTGNLSAKIVLIPAFDGLIIPIIVTPDTIKPIKPRFTISPPATTSEESVSVEITGEAGTKILVNGSVVGVIGSTGKTIITLDTSGSDGIKNFTITLKDSADNISDALVVSIKKIPDPKFNLEYKGLTFYHENLTSSNYRLNQLNDSEFNALNSTQKLQVANKLLSTLFFGYPQKELQEKINSGHFIENIRMGLDEDLTDKAWLESYILDENIFNQYSRWNEPQSIDILTRFYAMTKLDNYFLKNWIAYILTQTIMFSPAYELETTHTSNIANVYNRIVTFLNEESGMRYITYVHMMSEDNWRRFRSPEDNGREMLEIYLQDQDDSHVPLAGKALQNWKLNTDSDTLEVSLNENRDPINLFGTIIVNGDDFYRELVKSSLFTKGVTRRLVDFFFPQASTSKKVSLTQSIVASHPETWQDILIQIIFSEEYLLHNKRAKSAEESFYSLAKKLNYKHHKSTFYYLKDSLEDMHQASMKYKLGKLNRVPMDTLSFAYYHKYLREEVLLRNSNPDKRDNYSAWDRQGWSRDFISLDNFTFNENMQLATLNNFIHYLFKTIVSREATTAELNLFKSHMTYIEEGETYFHWAFDMFDTYDDTQRQIRERENRRVNIATLVLDYLSRLETTYLQKEVN